MSYIHIKHLAALSLVIAFSIFTLSDANAEKGNGLIPIAFKGYDAVSYFSGDTIRKGSSEYQTMYKGKRYEFETESNQQLFAANPDRFLPQFGGYCAQTATQHSPVASDPSIYLIDKGRLYQFSNLEAKLNWSNTLDKNKVGLIPLAIEGYDVTSYFGTSGPVKGQDAFQAVHNGKRYIFANQENQQKFAATPNKYLPQFDGYCAHSVSQGAPMPSQPNLYAIDQGKLLLFSSDDAKNAWEKEPAKTLEDANKYWKFNDTKRGKTIAAKNRWKKESKVTLFTF